MNLAKSRRRVVGRVFPVLLWLGAWGAEAVGSAPQSGAAGRRPNLLFVLADQWRAEAFGYAGNTDVQTPHLDALARVSVNCVQAIAGVPVCCPTRASLLTGQRPLTHGVFMNDVPLSPTAVSLARVLRDFGYTTGYIGKWHLNGDGRSRFIPRERRQGFEYWKALECTHDYNHSFYYADGPEKLLWDGYDALAQTEDARQYLGNHANSDQPFCLFLAWGPPHEPYQTAPGRYRGMYEASKLKLRPNVPERLRASAQTDLAGYYAHCTALDDCVAKLMATLHETGLERNTILVFTSDHGDMLGSHGYHKKQQPYEESLRVPLLFCWPAGLGTVGRTVTAPVNSEDLMPTLLGLCHIPIPHTVEGRDYSLCLHGAKAPADDLALISCPAPFGQWTRAMGGREYRGIRTSRYTYARDFNGPWLLFDNRADPSQLRNLVNQTQATKLQSRLEATLQRKLRAAHDEFLPAASYIRKWGYTIDATGTAPYTP